MADRSRIELDLASNLKPLVARARRVKTVMRLPFGFAVVRTRPVRLARSDNRFALRGSRGRRPIGCGGIDPGHRSEIAAAWLAYQNSVEPGLYDPVDRLMPDRRREWYDGLQPGALFIAAVLLSWLLMGEAVKLILLAISQL